MRSRETMRLRLLCDSETICEISESSITEPWHIGRDPDCDACVDNDPQLSSRHARVVREKRRLVFIDDGSRNGSFIRGKRIRRVRLESGCRIRMGRSYLVVDVSGDGVEPERPPEIVVLSGAYRGQRRALANERTVVGSGPDSDVILNEPTVSQIHAVIRRGAEHGWWITDEASTNGTTVNGEKLAAGKERLLRVGDHIGISHIDLRLTEYSGSSASQRRVPKVKVLCVAAGSAMCMILAWRLVQGSAGHRLQMAARFAAVEQFDEADAELVKAMACGNADRHRQGIVQFRQRMPKWRETSRYWREARSRLQAGDWIAASRALGSLDLSDDDGWTWSPPRSSVTRERARIATAAVECLMAGIEHLDRDRSPLPALIHVLEGDQNRIAALLGQLPSDVPEFLQPLIAQNRVVSTRITTTIVDVRRMNNVLGAVKQWSPAAIRDAARQLKALQSVPGAPLAVRRRAAALRMAVDRFHAPLGELRSVIEFAVDMRFQDALDMVLSLPRQSDVIIHPKLTALRGRLEKTFNERLRQVRQMQKLLQRSRVAVEKGRKFFEADRYWQDSAWLGRVLDCDALTQPVPKRGVEVGDYGTAVGSDAMCRFLDGICAQKPDSQSTYKADHTMLGQSLAVLRAVRELEAFLQRPENRWLNQGALRHAADSMRASTLDPAAAVIRRLTAHAESDSGRRAIVAAGIARVLADTQGHRILVNGQPIDTWIRKVFAAHRLDLGARMREYQRAPLRERIEIRRQILAVGIPGNAIVRRMWIEESAVRRGIGI